MKLVTFNIRCDYEQDRENNFCYRKGLILKKIRGESPDIICFQEVLPHVGAWLKENLSEYYVLGCGRSAELLDEQMAVAYKKEIFNLISLETFWLSPYPTVPGSRYEEQSICPRTCAKVFLHEEKTGRVIRIFNTHLDHEGREARKLALSQIMRKIKEEEGFSDSPLFLVGDFNAEPNDEELKEIKECADFSLLTEGIGATYHDYYRGGDPLQIDHIYLKNGRGKEEIRPISIRKWEDREGEVWLSDHYPVCLEF